MRIFGYLKKLLSNQKTVFAESINKIILYFNITAQTKLITRKVIIFKKTFFCQKNLERTSILLYHGLIVGPTITEEETNIINRDYL